MPAITILPILRKPTAISEGEVIGCKLLFYHSLVVLNEL